MAGSRIEDYELLGEVARGGMGIVYRARQRAPARIVALKMILPAHLDSLGAVHRFRAEAEAAASLEHEGILPIYAVGEHDGAPFYSMKFAEGGTLSARRDQFRDQPRAAAALTAKVARAVAYAHENGILHRDLKPGNVLFDSEGKPYVSDFGLAKWMQRESDLTQTLAILGTPFYMAPEQATDSHAVTAAADFYSLGAILYELLVGHPPVSGDTPLEVLHQAANQRPRRPRLTNRHIPPDLETICLKCLEKEPTARYVSAAALADDLERFCAGRTILARPAGPAKRTWRWTRRNPMLACLSLVSVAALSAIAAMFLFSFPKASAPTGRENLPVPDKSIAVLPFENLSDDKQNTYFADGVQEEILTGLAKVADLKVISRTSGMQYRDRAARNVRDIGAQLGVAHLLEGSVQRLEKKVLVRVRLIDARTDTNSWAHTYEHDQADIFALQSEIAKTVAGQLHAKLSSTEKAAIEKPATTDLAAYELYSRARALYADTTSNLSAMVKLPKAARLLDEAVARDSHFLLGWCLLSKVHGEIYFFGHDHSPDRLKLAKAAVDGALRFHPDAGEAHLALAYYYYHGFRDYSRARDELAIARRTLPNDAEVFEYASYAACREGRWEEATQSMERAVELDPRNFLSLQQLALTYQPQRRYADAERAWDRALEIVPGDPFIKISRAEIALDWRADIKPYQTTMAEVIAEDPNAAPDLEDPFYTLCERSNAAAERLLQNYPRGGVVYGGVNYPHAYWEGVVARWQGDTAKSRAAFTAARGSVAKTVENQPTSAQALSLLGMIDAGLGRKEEALREGRRACELLPISKDAISGTGLTVNLAQICAWTGEIDLAIELLTKVQRSPNYLTYGLLKLQPNWDPLRGDPRFAKLLEEATKPMVLK